MCIRRSSAKAVTERKTVTRYTIKDSQESSPFVGKTVQETLLAFNLIKDIHQLKRRGDNIGPFAYYVDTRNYFNKRVITLRMCISKWIEVTVELIMCKGKLDTRFVE